MIAHPVVTPKPAAHKRVSHPKPVEVEPLAQAPQAVEAPKPLPAGQLGVVESVREVTDPGKAQGIGAAAGVGVGAIVGNAIGNGSRNKNLLTVLGAVGGGIVGNAIEKQQRETRHWEIAVRFDDGTTRTLTSPAQPYWHAGDRVRMLDGRLQPV